jgi:hypothetical protein
VALLSFVELFAVLEHNRRIDVDAITIDKRKLIDTLPLARQSIQTLYILYDPCTISPTKDRMGA